MCVFSWCLQYRKHFLNDMSVASSTVIDDIPRVGDISFPTTPLGPV